MTRSRNWLFVLALGVGISAAASGCTVHGRATMRTSGSAVVYTEPPPPREDRPVVVRPGHVWVRGHWDWRNGQWTWIDGHWERQRAGYVYTDGRWERRGNGWYWVQGQWVSSGGGHAGGGVVVDTSDRPGGTSVTSGADGGHGHGHGHGGGTVDTSGASGGTVVTSGAGTYPTAAPPPPRRESYGTRAGFVWVTGRWDWRNGQWVWVDGHWERERANQVWIPGHWELQGNYYVWIEGRWGPRGNTGPEVRDHRRR